MSISNAQQAKKDKYLDSPIKYQGVVTTWRQVIRKRIIEDDWGASIVPVPDMTKRRNAAVLVEIMQRGWVPTGNELHPETIKYRQAQHDAKYARKADYMLTGPDATLQITKTGYEYAISVIRECNLKQTQPPAA